MRATSEVARLNQAIRRPTASKCSIRLAPSSNALRTAAAFTLAASSSSKEYEKRPRFGRVDTSRLWEEYQAQRELHKALRQAKLAGLAINRAQQFDAVKAAARAKRAVIKMTLKGAGRRIAYAAVQSELRQGIAAINARIREERLVLTSDTRQLSWVDWLQQQATNGRADALEALRVARGRGQATTISASKTAPAPPLEAPAPMKAMNEERPHLNFKGFP